MYYNQNHNVLHGSKIYIMILWPKLIKFRITKKLNLQPNALRPQSPIYSITKFL